MKLGTKISVAICAVFATVMAAGTVAVIIDERAFVEEELDIHGRLLGHVVASAAAETMAERGEAEARELVREIDARESRIAIRWLDISTTGAAFHPSALTAEVRSRLQDGQIVGRLSPQDESTLHTFVPVPSPGQPVRAIQIAESLEARNSHIENLVIQIVVGATIAFLLSGTLAYVLGRRLVGAPILGLVEVARSVGGGDFSRRANEQRSDELGTLAREMNKMASSLEHARESAEAQDAVRRKMERDLRHADRLATLGQMASGITHELSTPLQSITIRADFIAQKAGHIDGVLPSVEFIKLQSKRIAGISRNLLRFARKQPPRRAVHDLNALVDRVATLVRSARPHAAIQIDSADARVTAFIDPGQLEQVLTNLIVNAIQAMPPTGTVRLGIERCAATAPGDPSQQPLDCAVICVEDEGTGIDEDVLPHLFDPFFTTKDVDEGTGLGLSISHGIVQEHGGWIEVESTPGKGSRFSVYLPDHEV